MFDLQKLPFAKEDLAPYISAQTLEFHHEKHHQTYINNLNNLIKDTELANESLEKIILATFGDASKIGIFNNAAQAWNHDFYWQSLRRPQGEVGAEVKDILAKHFGSFEKFQEEFKTAALSQFGSGWVWLVLEAGQIKIVKTSNADLPIVHQQKPLLVIDVWEHAYYLDYQNRRGDYVEALINNLLNWDFFQKNLN